MTKKRSTKRALLLSALSLLMCVSMLVGSTFAWFTDSVTSAGNTIISGKLDVDLIGADNLTVAGRKLEFVDKNGNILSDILWEPGCTYTLEPVKVKNNGNLWLKYEIVISGIEGNAKLLEAIEWTVEGAPLKGTLAPETTTEALKITGHMKEEAGNEYQNQKLDGISITVYATQVNAESDSFGPDYDKVAPRLVWDGSVDTSWYDASATTYELNTPAKLAGLAELVNGGNSFKGKTIKLGADMDLNNLEWTEIGTSSNKFSGKILGNGFTIYNLKVSGTKGVGLIGFAYDAHIEGIHIDGANVTGENSVGAVLGYGYLAKDCLKNCIVENALVFALAGAKNEDGDKVGVVAGWTSNGNIIGNKAIDCEVYGCRDIGGVVGYVNGENRAVEVSGNTVEDVTVNVIKAEGYDTNKLGTNINNAVGRTGTKVTVKENSGNIVKEDNTVVASTNEDLKAAAAAGGEVVVVAGNYTFPSESLAADTTLNCAPGTVFEGTSKLNIKGATVVGATFSNPTGTAADQTINGKFVDCVFEGKNGLRWCYSGDTVEFENCVFSGSTYGVHFDGGAKKVSFKNCTISGFNATAGSIENITFEGCTFVGNGKSAYNGINLWGNGDFKDCTFVFDGSTKNEWIDLCGEEKTATFTNCVVTNGTTTKDIAEVVTKRNDNATIIVNGSVVAHSVANLDDALAKGENAVLIEDMRFSSSDTTANSGYGATGVSVMGGVLDGNGHKLGINNWGTWDAAVHTTGGTIKNLTINSGMRGIFMGSATADVKIDNVTIDGTIYTFNSDGGNKNYGVYISNSTLNGWTSHSDVHKEVVYTNCSFGEGQGYAFCRPYGPTQFIGCDFAAGFQVDAVGAVTFENCTIGGVALTAENLKTLVVGGIANATVK